MQVCFTWSKDVHTPESPELFVKHSVSRISATEMFGLVVCYGNIGYFFKLPQVILMSSYV